MTLTCTSIALVYMITHSSFSSTSANFDFFDWIGHGRASDEAATLPTTSIHIANFILVASYLL